jgi:antitoxin CcdA
MLDSERPMVRTTISIPADMAADAKELGVNLSRTCQFLLAPEIGRLKAQRWYESHKAAIDAYNERIKSEGSALTDQMTW